MQAHRSTGKNANCLALIELKKRSETFRTLALTATPGRDLTSIQHVVKNLGISKIEIRDESSPDVAPYVHNRNIVHEMVCADILVSGLDSSLYHSTHK